MQNYPTNHLLITPLTTNTSGWSPTIESPSPKGLSTIKAI